MWYGVAYYGSAPVWYSYGMTRYGMVSNGQLVSWYGIVWQGMVWQGIEWSVGGGGRVIRGNHWPLATHLYWSLFTITPPISVALSTWSLFTSTTYIGHSLLLAPISATHSNHLVTLYCISAVKLHSHPPTKPIRFTGEDIKHVG